MKPKIFITALAKALSAGLVTEQNQHQDQDQDNKQVTTAPQRGPAFVDNDNNGICDNFENGTPGNPNANGKGRLLDGSGRGRGMGYGMRNGRGGGRNFVDADKNGICDHYENGTAGQGRQINFVDADNNGICDRREVKK